MNSSQVQAVRSKPLGADYLLSILEFCVSVYMRGSEVYQELAKNSQGLALSTFWANMSLDLNQQALYWQKMQELAKSGQVGQALDKPREILAELKSIDSQLAVLASSASGKDSESASDAFLLAYAVEFHLLSPSLDLLDGAIQRLTKAVVPPKSYKEHLDNFIRGYTRQFGASVHLALARSLQRMYFMNKSLTEYTMLDPASGVLNRKGLERSVHPLASLAQRNNYAVAVLMVGIDNIDDLYDALGPEEGDRIVRAIAGCCKSVMRTSDVVGRYDYRAFQLFLPQVKHQFLHEISERLLHALHTRSPSSFKLSISVGGAYGSLDKGQWKTVEDLTKRAEDCLSRAILLKNKKVVIE